MATRRSREQRDKLIYLEYAGVNAGQVRVPASVLAQRFKLSRQRVYQIIEQQTKAREVNNARVSSRLNDTEGDAQKVADLLVEFLGDQ
jgi:Mor family transcriptional regulator